MPRSARLFVPGSLQYVSSRLVESDGCLMCEAERDRYLELLGRAIERSDWKCIAYCLTSTELQFAMVAGEQALDSWAKRVNCAFAQWLNRRRERIGPLFASRPILREVLPQHAFELLAWIHNAPVREHLAPNAAETTRSTHGAYIGFAPAPNWLDVKSGLEQAGFADQPSSFDAAVRQRSRAAITPSDFASSPALSRSDQLRAEARHARTSITGAMVLEAVATALNVSRAVLQKRRVRGAGSDARRLAMHVARAVGIPLAELAGALGISRQRASQIAATEIAQDQRLVLALVIDALVTD
jgi:hypothetical protein